MTPPEGVSSAQGWELCLQLVRQASVPSSHLWIKQSATLWLPKTPMLAPVCSVSEHVRRHWFGAAGSLCSATEGSDESVRYECLKILSHAL